MKSVFTLPTRAIEYIEMAAGHGTQRMNRARLIRQERARWVRPMLRQLLLQFFTRLATELFRGKPGDTRQFQRIDRNIAVTATAGGTTTCTGQSPPLPLTLADALRYTLIGRVIHLQQQTQPRQTHFVPGKTQA